MSIQEGFDELDNYFGEISKRARKRISGILKDEDLEYGEIEIFDICPSEDISYETTME